MELLAQILSFLGNEGSDILAGLLMVIGGLKVIAKYTPFKWDDDILNVIDAPVRYLAGFFKNKQ
jgi:hypothetical protein